jgi:hypothetical protein
MSVSTFVSHTFQCLPVSLSGLALCRFRFFIGTSLISMEADWYASVFGGGDLFARAAVGRTNGETNSVVTTYWVFHFCSLPHGSLRFPCTGVTWCRRHCFMCGLFSYRSMCSIFVSVGNRGRGFTCLCVRVGVRVRLCALASAGAPADGTPLVITVRTCTTWLVARP